MNWVQVNGTVDKRGFYRYWLLATALNCAAAVAVGVLRHLGAIG